MEKNRSFGRRTSAFSVIVLGWILCSYLVFRYTQLKNSAQSTTDLCQKMFGSSCDAALTSGFSWHLGFPLVGWGMAYFGMLGLLFSFRSRILDRFVILLAAFGVGVSCILTAILIRMNLACPLCFIIHFINLLSLVAIFLSVRPSISHNLPKQTFAIRPYFQWIFLLLIASILGGFSEVSIVKSFIPKEAQINLNEIVSNYQKEKGYNFPINNLSPVLGSSKAPVQLVVFSSFQCPACKGFAPTIESLHKKFGSKVGITFKNFPLSTTCNPRLSQNMQPQSCAAALAAIAAQNQKLFWSFHDNLFQSDLAYDEKTLKSIANNMGLNIDKWEQDRHSNEAKKQLSEDIKCGYEAGISGTPAVFINGRKVNNFQEEVLDFVIENELKKGTR